jgi:hypothetical protein
VLARLRDDWDSTAAGQRDLAEQVAAATEALASGRLSAAGAARTRKELRDADARLSAGIWRRESRLAALRQSRGQDTGPAGDLLCGRCRSTGEPRDGKACPDCDAILAARPPT